MSLGPLGKLIIASGGRLICPEHDRVCRLNGTLSGKQGHWVDKQAGTVCVPAIQDEEEESK